MSGQSNKDSEFNIFIANAVYPEAQQIFSFRPESLEEIKKDCYVVVDTNALLVPYNTGKDSLQQIRQTYKQLVGEHRLIIPGQVAREFADNRAVKIGEVFQQISRKASDTFSPLGLYPLLESIDDYQAAQRLASQISQLQADYKKVMTRLLARIRAWAWNDPITVLYSDLFAQGVVLDPPLDEEEIGRDLTRRYRHRIPPGYKDGGKEDEGIGDLLIWYAILHLGRTHKKSVLFVSGDVKADWYIQSEKQPLYPRYELISEFARHSEGKTLHIIRFSHLLELYGADESVVEEVRQGEAHLQAAATLTAKSTTISRSLDSEFLDPFKENLRSIGAGLGIKAAIEWLRDQYPDSQISYNSRGFPDITIRAENGSITGAEVYQVLPDDAVEVRVVQIMDDYVNPLNFGNFSAFVIFVLDTKDGLLSLSSRLAKIPLTAPHLQIQLCYIDNNLELNVVESL